MCQGAGTCRPHVFVRTAVLREALNFHFINQHFRKNIIAVELSNCVIT